MFSNAGADERMYCLLPGHALDVVALATTIKHAVEAFLVSSEQEWERVKNLDYGTSTGGTRAQNEVVVLPSQNGRVKAAYESTVVPTVGKLSKSRATWQRHRNDDAAAAPDYGSVEGWQSRARCTIDVFCATYGTAEAQVQVHSARCDVSELYDCIMWNAWMLLMGHPSNPAPRTTAFGVGILSVEGCRSNLAASIHGRSEVDRVYIFRALYTVAISYRSHTREALFEAVVNTADNSSQVNTTRNREDGLQDSNQLMALCEDLLRTRDDGNVEFRKDPMKAYVLKSDLPNVGRGHETMAKTCLNYLKSLGAYLILKPWAMISEQISRIGAFPLLEYVQRYWNEHYRLAESLKNELPMILHDMLEIAVMDLPESHDYLMIEIRRMTLDVGLQLCVRYEFKVLREIYTQMGASGDRNPFPALQSFPAPNFSDIELVFRRLVSKYVPAGTPAENFKPQSHHQDHRLLMMRCSESCTVDRAVHISQPQSECSPAPGQGQRRNRLSDDLWTLQTQHQARTELASSFRHLHLDQNPREATSDPLAASMSSICSSELRTPTFSGLIVPPPNILGDSKEWEMIDFPDDGL